MSARAWLATAVAALTVLIGRSALAHPTPGSLAFIDFTPGGARLEQDVPIEELERALHRRLALQDESAAKIVEQNAELLRQYAPRHLRVVSGGSQQPWEVQVIDVAGHAASDGPRARFRFELRAPQGAGTGSIFIFDDLVSHEVISHYTSVYVRSDWTSGASPGAPKLVGTLHAGRNEVTVERHGRWWRGLRSVIKLGVEHITSGTDHLMFLLALLMVSPVAAVGRRWRARESRREVWLELARVVSAFTLGHSTTLVLVALGALSPPSSVVESAIALSILVAALHALRPIFPRREALIAGGFGLVHGLAFASVLGGRDLGRLQTAWTLFGFNLGIELGQLGLAALTVPWLLLLARTRAYAAFRVAGALVVAACAAGWLLERAAGLSNPATPLVRAVEQHPLALLLGLAGAALAANLGAADLPRTESKVAG